MSDFELILYDRIGTIKRIINKYGEENFYLSLSGGKDSTVLHYLVDLALPNNKISRVFIDTGLEYTHIHTYIHTLKINDSRIEIIKPSKNVNEIWKNEGYPFKSKQHSHNLAIYKNNVELVEKVKKEIEQPNFKMTYEYFINLPIGVKTAIKYFYGFSVDKEAKEIGTSTFSCPQKLLYQFTPEFNILLSDMCCQRLKKDPVHKWQKENKKTIVLTGMRKSEGGRRKKINCAVSDEQNNLIKFHPLAIVDDKFMDWFIERQNIKLCELYYAPYNFKRTGCKGCPFALDLQKQLIIMEKYLPNEKKHCEILFKPVYEEYRRINYRLKNKIQLSLFDE